MTKKHFIALADMVKYSNANSYGIKECEFSDYQIEKLAEFCGKANPRFNRERWIAYINGECGKNGGKVKQSTAVKA